LARLFIERHHGDVAPAFLCLTPARGLNEDLPHGARG